MLFLGTGAALAQSAPPPHAPPPQREPPAQSRDRDDGGLRDSVRRVERQTGGEVLRAEPMQRDGREVYRMKVLTADGRVRVVQDDPQARDARPKRADTQVRRPAPERTGDPRDEDSDPF